MSLEAFNDPLIRKVQEKNIPYSEKNASKIRNEVRKAARVLERKVFPHGAESIVVEAENGDMVIAIRHSPEYISRNEENPTAYIKKQYYLHRILNTLYKDSFPRIYGSFIKEGEEGSLGTISGTIREKIIPREEGKKEKNSPPIAPFFLEMIGDYKQISEEESKEEVARIKANQEQIQKFIDIESTLEELGIRISLDTFDSSNFITDKNGNRFYVDMIRPRTIKPEAREKIKAYMTERGFNESDIRSVENALLRLETETAD